MTYFLYLSNSAEWLENYEYNLYVTPPAKEDSLAAQGIRTENPQQIERIS